MKMVDKKFVVVDIETTGNAAKKDDRIIQLAAVVIENGEMTKTYSSFIQPKKHIPPFITELTGITNEMVADAPTFSQVSEEFLSLLDGAYFVAHNVTFDWNFIQEELERCGYGKLTCPKIDTVELARILLPTADSYQLDDLAVAQALNHENPHQADSDAYATAEMLLLFLEKLRKLPLVTLQSLQKLCKYLQSDVADIVSAIVIEKMLRVNEDEKKFDVYRGIAIKKRNFSFAFHGEELPSFTEYLSKQLMSDFSKHYPNFEVRDGQMEMMETVYEAFLSEQIALIEAGTGIGKSLGYLLPSVFFAKETEKPVVISTKTTQLQQQLMEKEIPLLKKVLNLPFEVALLKGRNHYLCLQKFEQILGEEDGNYDSILTKAKILVWLLETETGEADELNLPSGGELLWQRVCVDSYSRSPFNPWKTRCFYEKTVNRLFIADVIITNHTMLFQEADENKLLSACEYIVLDEAHHVEEVASKVYGKKLFAKSFYYKMNKIVELLPTVKEIAQINSSLYQKLETTLGELKFESDELFHLLYNYVLEQLNNIDGNKAAYRFQTEKETHEKWQIIMELTHRILEQMKNFFHLTKELKGIESRTKYASIREWLFTIATLEETGTALKELLLIPQQNEVTWMELDVKGTFHSFYIYSQPVSVAKVIQEKFFQQKKSVVFTSGTLTVNKKFDYIKGVIGLDKQEVITKEIPSMFPYEKLAELFIPSDMPNIKDVDANVYAEKIALSIAKIVAVTKGRMLVLFTSQKMLKDTYEWTKEMKELQEFVILGQGVNTGSRMRLMKQFKKLKKSILFGTTSFWEGVDLPGEILQCLVIVRLPFSPPDAPITEAKIEGITKNGGNPFRDYSLPQAILRFKQGFGRLVRTKDDKGVVIVLDKRMTTTTYGKKFLDSIPSIPIHEGNLEQLVVRMEEFLS